MKEGKLMIGAFFELELVWGFGIRYPQGTAVQMAPPLPPPSTAIGAIAESIAIQYGLGENIRVNKEVCSTAYAIAEATKTAAFALSPESPTGLAVKAELTRIFQATYLRPNYKGEPSKWFGAQAFAQVYGPSARLWMMIVFDEEKLVRSLKKLGVDDEPRKVLERIIIRRIGSKESKVITRKKIVGEVIERKDVKTYFYTTRKKIRKGSGKYTTELLLWLPTKESFCKGTTKYEIFVVPSGPLSSQALLTPPTGEGVKLSSAYCMENYCIGDYNEQN